MEIKAMPQRAANSERRRLLVGMLVFAPIVLLVLLPAVLGINRNVITDDSMDGTLSRGSVALSRLVPPSELVTGDVVTFHPPGAGADGLVTRRIVSIDGSTARTRGDAAAKRDAWILQLTEPTYPRVVADVPWVGYPFIGGGWVLLSLIALAALVVGFGIPRWRIPGGPAHVSRESPATPYVGAF